MRGRCALAAVDCLRRLPLNARITKRTSRKADSAEKGRGSFDRPGSCVAPQPRTPPRRSVQKKRFLTRLPVAGTAAAGKGNFCETILPKARPAQKGGLPPLAGDGPGKRMLPAPRSWTLTTISQGRSLREFCDLGRVLIAWVDRDSGLSIKAALGRQSGNRGDSSSRDTNRHRFRVVTLLTQF